jgi:hypothetical protein
MAMNTKNNSQESVPQYDAHLIPAESAARQHREEKALAILPMRKMTANRATPQ